MQIHNLEARAGVSYGGLYPHLKFLEEEGFVDLDIEEPEDNVPRVSLRENREFATPIWEVIRDYCNAEGASVMDIIVDLDFSGLD